MPTTDIDNHAETSARPPLVGTSESIEADLNEDLLQRYGPLVGGSALYELLGYPSAEAFRQACHRERLPIPVFRIPHRRGHYALSRDIAGWLAQLRSTSLATA